MREFRATLPGRLFLRDPAGVETAIVAPALTAEFQDASTATLTVEHREEFLDAPFRPQGMPAGAAIAAGRYRFDGASLAYIGSNSKRLAPHRRTARRADSTTATGSGATGGLRVRFSPQLATTVSVGRDHLDAGGATFDTTLVSLRVDGSFSTRMFLNAFVQYNSVTQQVPDERPLRLHPPPAERPLRRLQRHPIDRRQHRAAEPVAGREAHAPVQLLGNMMVDMSEPTASLLSQSTGYTGRVFTVTTDRVRLPNGREATLDIVQHRGSVVMLPMQDDGHVILIRQYRHALGRWIWELPAGSLDPGEEPAAAAARECEEEIGLVAGTVEFLGAWYPTPGFLTEVMNFYKLSGLHEPDPNGPQAHKDEDEDIRAQVFTLDEARAMVKRGEIIDLKTAWGLTLV